MPQTMTFEVVKVREALARNREAHQALVALATEGYRRQAIKELEAMLEEARAGGRIRRALPLIEPMDMTREYDRILGMLEMTNQTVIELTPTEFSNFVLDDWAWTEQVTATNSRYVM